MPTLEINDSVELAIVVDALSVKLNDLKNERHKIEQCKWSRYNTMYDGDCYHIDNLIEYTENLLKQTTI